MSAFIAGANGIGITDIGTLVTLSDGRYLNWARGINDLGQIISS